MTKLFSGILLVLLCTIGCGSVTVNENETAPASDGEACATVTSPDAGVSNTDATIDLIPFLGWHDWRKFEKQD